MILGRLIELILLRVNGGELTDDGSVQRSDIRAYLPIALNFATTKFYYSNKKEDGSRDFPSCFYTSFPNLTIDRTQRIPIVTLPQTFLQMAGNQGIRRVFDDCGNTFTPLQDNEVSMVNYYSKCFPDLRTFLPMGNTTIALYNLSKFAKHVNAVVMIDPVNYTDETDLPIAAGIEADVIDLAVQHFTAQRQQPADVDADTNDLNAS